MFLQSQIKALQGELEQRSEEVLQVRNKWCSLLKQRRALLMLFQARRETGQSLARINQELMEKTEESQAARYGQLEGIKS